MPFKPLQPRGHQGCYELIGRPGDGSFCGRCRVHSQQHERQRYVAEAGRSWYPTARWRRIRKHGLSLEPDCLNCALDGRITTATVRDHVTSHHGDPELFWSMANHASLCASCHTAKGNKERGFGSFDLKRYEQAHRDGIKAVDAWDAWGKGRGAAQKLTSK